MSFFQRKQSDFADCQQKDLCLSVGSVGQDLFLEYGAELEVFGCAGHVEGLECLTHCLCVCVAELASQCDGAVGVDELPELEELLSREVRAVL